MKQQNILNRSLLVAASLMAAALPSQATLMSWNYVGPANQIIAKLTPTNSGATLAHNGTVKVAIDFLPASISGLDTGDVNLTFNLASTTTGNSNGVVSQDNFTGFLLFTYVGTTNKNWTKNDVVLRADVKSTALTSYSGTTGGTTLGGGGTGDFTNIMYSSSNAGVKNFLKSQGSYDADFSQSLSSTGLKGNNVFLNSVTKFVSGSKTKNQVINFSNTSGGFNIDTPVPEPASFASMGGALLALGLFFRRK
ncbi:MAG: PEP-CTERM sorting domain-containing protein [Acidobacteria bacterium]|nr:PEP-CTERM sorting domain-containing protein [Acidobacteriota bacterium]